MSPTAERTRQIINMNFECSFRPVWRPKDESTKITAVDLESSDKGLLHNDEEQEKLLRQFANSTLSGSTSCIDYDDYHPDHDNISSDLVSLSMSCWEHHVNTSANDRTREGLFSDCQTGITTHDARYNEEFDLNRLIHDQETIDTQRRLLDQFERAKKPATSKKDVLGSSPSTIVTAPSTYMTIIDQGSSTSSSFCGNDYVTRIGKQTIRVKGTRHTHDSIAKGAAVIVQCSYCQAVLQLPSNAKNLFCTLCKHVTPMEQALNVSTHRLIGVADSDIARKVQGQEIDVASSLKIRALLRDDTGNGVRVRAPASGVM